MYSMSVVVLYNNSWQREKTRAIYEQYKKFIPERLRDRQDYQYDEEAMRIHIPISRTSVEYQDLKKIAQESNVLGHEYEFTEYSQEEIENAEFFQMFVRYPLQAEGTMASDYGTKYKNCCPICNIGGEPDGDVLVDRKFVKKYDIASLCPDIFVSKQVKWLIEENALTGVRFEHRVLDYKGRELPEYYVMTFDNIMKPMDSRTWLTYDPPAYDCKTCGIKVPYLKSSIYYKREDLENLKDFNLSIEHINNYKVQQIIVSKKVKEVFAKAKVRVGYWMINVV